MITSLTTIIRLADEAAQAAVRTGAVPPNPYPDGCEAAAEFERRLNIALLRHSQPVESEASA